MRYFILPMIFLITASYNLLAAFMLFIYYLIFAPLLDSKVRFISTSILASILIILSLLNFNWFSIYSIPYNNLKLIQDYGFNLGLKKLFYTAPLLLKSIIIDQGLGSVFGLMMFIKLALNAKPQTKIIKQAKSKILKDSGVFLGYDIANQEVVIDDKEFNQHSLVIGTTGSGKTTTLMNIVNSCCSRGLPLIYLDGKGNIKLALKLKKICEKYGRTLKVFTLDPNDKVPNLAYYNPLAYGNFSEWKNKIVTLIGEAENRGQEHYSIEEQSYINLVCEILNKSNKYIDLEGFIAYIKYPQELQKLANQISPELGLRLANFNISSKNTIDLVKILEMFYYSQYGKLFSTSKKSADSIINLKKAVENGEIVLFLFDAASYKTDTNLLGKLVINDINSVWASFGRNGQRVKGYCIFDEFASYASANLSNVLSLQRENGLHAVIGTQSVNSINMESNNLKRIAAELIANCNTYIIHKLNDSMDIELLQKASGMGKNYRVTNHINPNNLSGSFSTQLINEFYLDGQAIRQLEPGCAFIYRSSINALPKKVMISSLDI